MVGTPSTSHRPSSTLIAPPEHPNIANGRCAVSLSYHLRDTTPRRTAALYRFVARFAEIVMPTRFEIFAIVAALVAGTSCAPVPQYAYPPPNPAAGGPLAPGAYPQPGAAPTEAPGYGPGAPGAAYGSPPDYGPPPTYGSPPGYGPPPDYGSAPAYSSAPDYGPSPTYGSAPTYGPSPTYGSAPDYGPPPAYGSPPAYGGPAGGVTRDVFIARHRRMALRMDRDPERAAAVAARQFDLMDTDHDGILEPEERAAWRAAHGRGASGRQVWPGPSAE